MEFVELIHSTLRLATPILLASMAGLLSERSGQVQIHLEAKILIGALIAAAVTYFTKNTYLGFFSAGLAGALVGVIYFFLTNRLKADQVAVGVGINILILGLCPLITKYFFDSTGSTPTLDISLRAKSQSIILLASIFFLVCFYILQKTKWGLYIKFSGEAPKALLTEGISASKVRANTEIFSGFLAGLGGACLSLALSAQFSPNMSAGRGFIALAAVIIGGWRPVPTLLAVLFFSAVEAAQIKIQILTTSIPTQLIQILPYILTIIAVSGIWKSKRAPLFLGKNGDN